MSRKSEENFKSKIKEYLNAFAIESVFCGFVPEAARYVSALNSESSLSHVRKFNTKTAYLEFIPIFPFSCESAAREFCCTNK